MLVLIGVFVAAAILSLLVVALGQPKHFRVERSSVMNAPAAVVFAEVNDLQRWGAWSPWAKMDPTCLYSFEGPQAGVGSTASWNGNSKVGAGNMTITESRPNEFIALKMNFLKPFKGEATCDFTFSETDEQTRVTWAMHGKNNFLGKVMSVVMNCDKMVGGQYEKGLANLKQIVEAR